MYHYIREPIGAYCPNIYCVKRMREYAAASWQTCEKMHLLMLADEQPENEKQRMDPDHW